MNYGSSNAKVITEREYECKARINRPAAKRSRDMLRQRMCGVLIIAAAVFAVSFAEDMELVWGLVPVGLYFIFTKKTILTF